MDEATTKGMTELQPWVREMLRCPVTGAPLREQRGPHGQVELVSTDAATPLAYPVRDGVPILLADEARSIGPAPIPPDD